MEQPNVTDVTDVIDELLKANEEWATKKPSEFFTSLPNPQEPKVLWIGCSDSRVPASVVTSSPPGAIFAHTNIANQFHNSDDNAHSVLSYAVNTVGVKHVVLVGHSGCGGVKAAITTANKEENVEPDTPLTRWLKPLVDLVKDLKKDPEFQDLSEKAAVDKDVEAKIINQVVEANIIKQVDNIWDSVPIFAASGNKVSVHGWMYDLNTGLIKKVVVRG